MVQLHQVVEFLERTTYMDYSRLEYLLSVEDWESVASEMRVAIQSISLECFEAMLRERHISRARWISIFLNTKLYCDCKKCDNMLRMILKHTWDDVGDDLRWALVSAILSIKSFDLGRNSNTECIPMAVEFVSEYINISRDDVARVFDNPGKISVELVIADCPGVQ